jgi:NAD(P)-dependent dehydrogenase (short-subunit alcohol dehydrogenase family)
MRGKKVLITGANQGLGKASAIALAKMGADLVLVCRNEEKGRAAADEAKAAGAASVSLVVGDMSSQKDIRRFAREVIGAHDRIDVLMNNAGVIVPTRHTTVDGIEETFAINHLGYFILTTLLLDVLKKSAPARVVNVSSDAHRSATMHWDDLQFSNGFYRPIEAYGQSKLCNILFTRELAKRLEGTGVTANAAHPGPVGSGFGHTYGGFSAILATLARPFILTPEQGARTQVWLASSSEVEGISGKYFAKCRERTPNRAAREPDAPARLWSVSEELTRASAE